MTQQICDPRDSCLLLSFTTLALQTMACAKKPQVPLSGDFLYHLALLLVYWLVFLIIKKALLVSRPF